MKLLFVGDIALGDHAKAIGFGFYSRYKEGIPDDKMARLFPSGLKSDLAFGNLEFNIGDEQLVGTSVKDIEFKGVDRYIPFLARSGINVLNIANNHIFQYGLDCFERTVTKLRRQGIHICGIKEDFHENNSIKIDQERVAFLGWSERPRQYRKESPPYNEFGSDDPFQRIACARKRSEIVCVSLHWGMEFIQIPSPEETEIARNMIDAGATIVIGHHPHVLRNIETYREGLIIYSLGNFIADMIWEERTRQTGCVIVETVSGKINRWEFHPAYIDDDYFPRYYEGEKKQKVLSDLRSTYDALSIEAEKTGYADLAKRELNVHRRSTLKYFCRNIFKYRPSIAIEILINGVRGNISI